MSSTTVIHTRVGSVELPGEITDYVIDYLHDDIDSLRICALVTPAWTTSAQFHIFRTWPVVCRQDKPGKTAQELLKWAKSDSGNQVKPLVTTLIVKATRVRGFIAHQQPFRIATLKPLLACLINVKRITLQNVVLHSDIIPPPIAQSAIPSRTLSRLSIISCNPFNVSFTPIGHLLCLFPAINRLDLVNALCSWDENLYWHPWFTSLLSALRVKEVYMQNESTNYAGYEGLWHMLEHADPPVPLRKLGVAVPIIQGHTPSLAALLWRYTSTLVALRIDVLPNTLRSSVLGGYSGFRALQECTALRTLRLSMLTLCEGPDTASRAPAELRCAYINTLNANIQLVSAAPPQLQRIVIVVFHIGPFDADSRRVLGELPAWHELDEALLGLQQLQSVLCVASKEQISIVGVRDKTSFLPRTLYRGSDRRPMTLVPSETNKDNHARLLVDALPGVSGIGLLEVAEMD